MLGRVQPQNSFGDEALELYVSDSHLLVKVGGLVDWAAFEDYWPRLHGGTTGKPSSAPLVCFKMLLLKQSYGLSDPECGAGRCWSRDRPEWRVDAMSSILQTCFGSTFIR